MWTDGRALGLVWLSCAASSACSDDGARARPETDASSSLSQPVLGGTGTTGCSPTQRTTLRHALLVGRARALSDDFATCMELAITRRPYVACEAPLGQTPAYPVDPPLRANRDTAALATQLARAENGIRVTCADLQRARDVSETTRGLTLWEDIHHAAHDELEEFSLDTDGFLDPAADLDPARLAALANTIWHEVFHTQGFWHDSPGTDCIGQTLGQSMPVIAGDCIGAGAVSCDDQSACNEGGTIALQSSDGCKCLSIFGADDVPCRHQSTFPDCDGPVVEIGPATPLRDLGEDGDRFGAALAAADFDGDGFDDLAVGVPGEDDGSGAVDVYFGTRYGLIPILRLRGAPGSGFGSALAAADFDRDGLADLAIGGPGFVGELGMVTIVFGANRDFGQAAVLDYWPDRRRHLFGREAGDRFGASLAAGTLADGSNALAVGSPGTRAGRGAVSLFATGATDPRSFVVEREIAAPDFEAGAGFGTTLDALHSSSGTSLDVLAIGAPFADGERGRAFVFDARAPAGLALRELVPAQRRPGARFGTSVALGDVAGAGEQVIVAAPGLGSVLAFSADAPPATMKDGSDEQELPQAIGAVAVMGGAVLGGAPFAGAGFVEILASDVLGGPSSIRRLDQFALSENSPGDEFGSSFASGDFDGDGKPELAVGAPGERARGSCGPPSGAFFVFEEDPGVCRRKVPTKGYSQEGGLSEFEAPLVAWAPGVNYTAGARVHYDCELYVARSAHFSSLATSPESPRSPWSLLREPVAGRSSRSLSELGGAQP